VTDLTYLSLGAGVQSSALLVMSNLGLHDCPKADVAIFADTQSEPQWVYDQLDWLKTWSTIPVEVCTAGNLGQHALTKPRGTSGRFVNIPLWTSGDAGKAVPLRRQCTREYKITPIHQHVRRRLGYRPRQHFTKAVDVLIGISVDEVQRAKPSRLPNTTARFPLLDAGFRRQDCLTLLADHQVPVPKKSACVFCPYRDDGMWIELRDDAPDDFAAAVQFDRAMRSMTPAADTRPAFVHKSLQPLDEVDFQARRERPLFDSFTEECEGMCGV
jgi:hypothetical protein